MIVVECEQRTDAWFEARLGLPTASRFDKLVTPKTGKLSASARVLLHECLAEYMTGESGDRGGSAFMARGTDMETKARQWYELEFDIDVQQVGFVTTDDGSAGCSPDGLVGAKGGLEIKVPSAVQHVAYMLDNDALRFAYRAQVQGSLWVTGRVWWDLLSYSPCMTPVLIRCDRDDDFIATLAGAVADLHAKKTAALIRFGYMPDPFDTPPQPHDEQRTHDDIIDELTTTH